MSSSYDASLQARCLSGMHMGDWLYDEDRTKSYWTNLAGDGSTPWDKRRTAKSEFVTEPDPQWVKITMITHKKKGEVVVRTIIPSEGYLSERNHKFDPDRQVSVRSWR